MSEDTAITETVAVYVEQLVRGMLNEDDRRRKRGDTSYLDAQLDAFEAKRRACQGPDCPTRCGCRTLVEIMARLEKEIERRNGRSLPGIAP
jgi:hypothetical protein